MDQRVQRIREAEARHAKRDKEGAPLVLLDRAVRACIDGRITREQLDEACLEYLKLRGRRHLPTVDDVLKHLKRAGHDRLGEFHKVYPKPGTWDIEVDKPGCLCDLWLVDDEAKEDEEEAPRTQCDVCTCGYNDVLALFEPGKEV